MPKAREQNIERLARLAGGIAHDFNNLLCAILGNAELIREMADDPAAVQARIEYIIDAAVRGARLSNQLLAFGGGGALSAEPLKLPRELRRLVRHHTDGLPIGVQVTLVASADLPPAMVDPGQLRQAIDNLLDNAREAVDAWGTIRVTAELADLPASPSFVASGGPQPGTTLLRIRIHDSGTGFSVEALEHLFEPYYSTTDGGHGLGLSAVQGIAQAHGGALDVGFDGGAVVDLYLPLADHLITEPAVARVSELIWVVDDEPSLVEIAEIVLTRAGYRVRCFTNPRAALAAAGDERPAVIVLDVVMPGLRGPELLAKLRLAGVESPVLYSSGYSPHGLDLGDAAFLQKAYSPSRLVDAVTLISSRTGSQ